LVAGSVVVGDGGGNGLRGDGGAIIVSGGVGKGVLTCGGVVQPTEATREVRQIKRHVDRNLLDDDGVLAPDELFYFRILSLRPSRALAALRLYALDFCLSSGGRGVPLGLIALCAHAVGPAKQ